MEKVLLHICCGPCSIYPFYKIKEKGFEVTGFFYNPNIYPEEEFLRRKIALESFSKREGFSIIYFDYTPEDFSFKIGSNIFPPERCPKCWELRMEKSALYAKENNFPFFSTTLLISPYQNHEIIKEIGEKISQEYKVRFLYEDFRIGFHDSQNRAKELELYCQNYCGCIYSKIEREKKLLRKK